MNVQTILKSGQRFLLDSGYILKRSSICVEQCFRRRRRLNSGQYPFCRRHVGAKGKREYRRRSYATGRGKSVAGRKILSEIAPMNDYLYMEQDWFRPGAKSTQDDLYQEVAKAYGAALDRLARAYEADADKRKDLLQEIHFALWRSFAGYGFRCSLRTWVYRVAHNTATSYVMRQRRRRSETLISLQEIEMIADSEEVDLAADRHKTLERLLNLIQRLKPLDRQVMLSYLEGVDAGSIGEIVGISPANVATRIHRLKSILINRFRRRMKP
ncbi:MAG: RNA polymerase sigma factor [Acidobacteriota bacterium]|nr:RNA polymerase sigma factor [Acidobacteriota bacterium]